MYRSETSIRVRYAETDQMGYVYYGNYAMYYEIGRVEALRKLGFSYRQLEEEKRIMMPVLENYSRYLLPGKYDDELKIVVTIPEMPSARIMFNYDIYNEREKLIHSGKTTLCFVSKDTGRPCKAPQELSSLLEPYFQDNE